MKRQICFSPPQCSQDTQKESFNDYVKSFNRCDIIVWKSIKSNQEPQTENPPLRNSSTRDARNDKEKVKLFAKNLVHVFILHDEDVNIEIKKYFSSISQKPPSINFFTVKK